MQAVRSSTSSLPSSLPFGIRRTSSPAAVAATSIFSSASSSPREASNSNSSSWKLEVSGALSTQNSAGAANALSRKLGTFHGVFIPVMLNIVGVVLFLRLGWSVAQAGWTNTLLMFAAGALQMVLTESAMFALATDEGDAVGKLKAGGAYYLISRSLGVSIGVSSGILLVFARAASSAFYFAALAEEVFESYFDTEAYDRSERHAIIFKISSSFLFCALMICLGGTKYFSKANMALFLLQCGAIFLGVWGVLFQGSGIESGYTGPSRSTLLSNSVSSYSRDVKCGDKMCSWRLVFCVIFPSFTGFMEGLNLSGDLRTPSSSVITGTTRASCASIAVYTSVALALSASFTREYLNGDMTPMQSASSIGWLVAYGIIISAASSGLGTLFGGARIMHAIAQDGVVAALSPLTKLSSKLEPLRATCLVYGIAQFLLIFGTVDTLAPILGALCLLISLALEAACWVVSQPGSGTLFSPKYRFWSSGMCVVGAIYSVVLMFALDPIAALVTLTTFLGIVVLVAISESPSGSTHLWSQNARSRLIGQFQFFHKTSRRVNDFLKKHKHSIAICVVVVLWVGVDWHIKSGSSGALNRLSHEDVKDERFWFFVDNAELVAKEGDVGAKIQVDQIAAKGDQLGNGTQIVKVEVEKAAEDSTEHIIKVEIPDSAHVVKVHLEKGDDISNDKKGPDAHVIKVELPGGEQKGEAQVIKVEIGADAKTTDRPAPISDATASSPDHDTVSEMVAEEVEGKEYGDSTEVPEMVAEVLANKETVDVRLMRINYLFSYGSNSAEQLHERLGGKDIISFPARIQGMALAFAGESSRWQSGAIATILPKEGGMVWGNAALVSEIDLVAMDEFESHYARKKVKVQLFSRDAQDGWEQTDEKDAFAYVMLDEYMQYSGPPSKEYIQAICKNILGLQEHIAILRADTLDFVETEECIKK